MPPSAPNTEALPDDVLGGILGFAGLSEGPSVTLVCKRWNRLFYAESSLWRSFRMAPGPAHPARCAAGTGTARLHAKHSLLRRVGGLVEELEVCNQAKAMDDTLEWWELAGGGGAGGHPSLVDVLSLLQPAKLTQLTFLCNKQLPEAIMAALPRFSKLQGLVVRSTGVPTHLPASLPAVLAQLPQLRTLACTSAAVPTGLVEAISQNLTQLTCFSLMSSQRLPALQQLTRLTRLQHLALRDYSQAGGPRLLPTPSSFPTLQYFDFLSPAFVQVGGACLRECRLRKLDGGGVELSLFMPETLPSLHQLLTALLPPGVTLAGGRLDLTLSNRLAGAAFDPASWRSSHLAALAGLELDGNNDLRVLILEALLAQATQLRSLHISRFRKFVLPARIVGKAGLHTLSIRYCGLDDLPPGPYLSTLRTLSLTVNSFIHLPPTLATATSLCELNITNMFRGRPCDLTQTDMSVLECLPQLTKLHLGLDGPGPAALPNTRLWVESLQHSRPQLTVV